MARDDYDVIVYKVLVYLYACLKRKIMFEEITFQHTVRKNVDNDEYFYDILKMMQEEGLITGLVFKGTWQGDSVLANDLKEMEITSNGIHYLEDNLTDTAKAGGCSTGDDVKGWQLLKDAVKNGGIKLDSYSGNHKFYIRQGFEPISWCKFDENYVNPDWFKSDNKPEDVIFYKYTGRINSIRLEEFKKMIPASRDYDTAEAMRDRML